MLLQKNLSILAARAADDKKGERIALLHVRPMTSLTDYVLLVCAASNPHLAAVEDGVRQALKAYGIHALHADGKRSDTWRALDYGWLIVHIMNPETRAFYAIDKIFSGGKAVVWSEHGSTEAQPEPPAPSAAPESPRGGLRPRVPGSARPARPGSLRSGARGRPSPKRPRKSAFRRRNRA
ncbi:MAG: ribosome silencing factor [Elusimicrobia bacterium GWA2_69_24]|nr:MAG: ribosome silencing factor [Elusimicrobia bacterium GWA2_69_24]HBL16352.1 ribosome silencing factor [Elusimicrobiota bacterium]